MLSTYVHRSGHRCQDLGCSECSIPHLWHTLAYAWSIFPFRTRPHQQRLPTWTSQTIKDHGSWIMISITVE